jgi:hypothetical protein
MRPHFGLLVLFGVERPDIELFLLIDEMKHFDKKERSQTSNLRGIDRILEYLVRTDASHSVTRSVRDFGGLLLLLP